MFQKLMFFNMKKITSFIFLFLILSVVNCTLLIDNCQSQWVQQSVPVTSGQFFDMKFVNANTGFIAHSTNVLLKTTDAGYNWVVNNTWSLRSISIVDSQCVYFGTSNYPYSYLYRTTNLGVTWDSLLASTDYYPFIHFFNHDTGLISGGDTFQSFIWRTTNGGQTKQLIATFNTISSGKFFFLKEKINGEYYGWMYYPGSFIIRSTTNSGLTWNTLPDFSGNLNSLFFVNQDTGYATKTGYTNYIYMTTNGGVNWVGKFNYLNEIYFDIFFVNAQKGWVSGPSNKICVTTNGGNNWGTQNVQGDYSSEIFFLDSLNGWTSTSVNTISRTTNGGGPITSIQSQINTISSNYKLYQNYPNPFNPSTKIKYKISKSSKVEISVYDVAGKVVSKLINEHHSPGIYEVTFDAKRLNSGVYFYRITAEGYTETKKMIYMK